MQRYNLFFNWPNLFSKNFLVCFFELHSLFESGCKITTFFRTTKTFFKKNFSSILMNLLPSRKRVQKYNNFLNWPNISRNFFEVFFKWLRVRSINCIGKYYSSLRWVQCKYFILMISCYLSYLPLLLKKSLESVYVKNSLWKTNFLPYTKSLSFILLCRIIYLYWKKLSGMEYIERGFKGWLVLSLYSYV